MHRSLCSLTQELTALALQSTVQHTHARSKRYSSVWHTVFFFSLPALAARVLVDIQSKKKMQGEEQKKLDVLSNEVFVKALVSSGRTVTRSPTLHTHTPVHVPGSRLRH
jgi:fructose-1,6-bisphosphatase